MHKETEAEHELLAAQPAKVYVAFYGCDRAGTADDRNTLKATEIAGVIRCEDVLPDADGENATAHRAKTKGLGRYSLIEHHVWWHGTQVPDFYTIPVKADRRRRCRG